MKTLVIVDGRVGTLVGQIQLGKLDLAIVLVYDEVFYVEWNLVEKS